MFILITINAYKCERGTNSGGNRSGQWLFALDPIHHTDIRNQIMLMMKNIQKLFVVGWVKITKHKFQALMSPIFLTFYRTQSTILLTDNKNAEYENIEKLLELLGLKESEEVFHLQICGSQTFIQVIWVVTLFQPGILFETLFNIFVEKLLLTLYN